MDAHIRDCPTCHALHHLLLDARPEVARQALQAHARGRGWGVFVGHPDECGAENDEEAAALEVAREAGYYVAPMRVEGLVRMIPTRADLPADRVAGQVRQLLGPPPEAHVHALAVLDHAVLAFDVPVSQEAVDAFDAAEAEASAVQRLFDLSAPEVRRLAPGIMRSDLVCVVTGPEDPLLDRVSRVRGAPLDDEARAAARAAGVYVGAFSQGEAIELLPLEGLDAEDGARAVARLRQSVPEGHIRVALAYAGAVTIIRGAPP